MTIDVFYACCDAVASALKAAEIVKLKCLCRLRGSSFGEAVRAVKMPPIHLLVLFSTGYLVALEPRRR